MIGCPSSECLPLRCWCGWWGGIVYPGAVWGGDVDVQPVHESCGLRKSDGVEEGEQEGDKEALKVLAL